jgi:hypothetical protein
LPFTRFFEAAVLEAAAFEPAVLEPALLEPIALRLRGMGASYDKIAADGARACALDATPTH